MVAVALVVGLAGCGDSSDATSDEESPPASRVFGQDDERGYAMAATHGDLVWTAGHLPESVSQAQSVAGQTEAVMEDLKATLEDAGASFDTVVMTNVYLTDWETWPEFNETYKRYFDDRLPPRTTVEVSQLGGDYDIEISMVAYVEGNDSK